MGHNFDVLDWTKQGVIPDKGVNEGAVCGHALPKLPNSVLRVVALPSQHWLPSHNFHESELSGEAHGAGVTWTRMLEFGWGYPTQQVFCGHAKYIPDTAMNLTQERGVWVGKKKKDMGVQVTLHDAKPGAECSPKALFWIKIHSVAHKDYHIFFQFFFEIYRLL